MPSIEIRRQHKKPLKDAKVAVEKVAEKIAERFDIEYEWQGNTLHFERSGVNGNIALSKGEVCVTANLSFFLGALKGPIEREIDRQIEQEFS
ncbi:MAG: polyhydroxyalkanoic acid system family protein [Pseudomarimonas sp.]